MSAGAAAWAEAAAWVGAAVSAGVAAEIVARVVFVTVAAGRAVLEATGKEFC